MSRRRYVVAYDIRSPDRLRRVHDVVEAHGYMLQYSVYICDLSDVEKIGLKSQLRDQMNQTVDSVVLIDLGDPDRRGSECFEFIGSRTPLPSVGGATII